MPVATVDSQAITGHFYMDHRGKREVPFLQTHPAVAVVTPELGERRVRTALMSSMPSSGGRRASFTIHDFGCW